MVDSTPPPGPYRVKQAFWPRCILLLLTFEETAGWVSSSPFHSELPSNICTMEYILTNGMIFVNQSLYENDERSKEIIEMVLKIYAYRVQGVLLT